MNIVESEASMSTPTCSYIAVGDEITNLCREALLIDQPNEDLVGCKRHQIKEEYECRQLRHKSCIEHGWVKRYTCAGKLSKSVILLPAWYLTTISRSDKCANLSFILPRSISALKFEHSSSFLRNLLVKIWFFFVKRRFSLLCSSWTVSRRCSVSRNLLCRFFI